MRWCYRAGLACIALLCAAPLVAAGLPLLWTPGETLAEAAQLLGSGRLWALWAKTCGIAAATALAATVLGAPLGYWLGRTQDRRWLGPAALLTAPLLIPTHVLAVAWVDVLGQQGILNQMCAAMGLPSHPFPLYTPAGVIFVQTMAYFPFPLWAVWNGRRHIDPAIVDAARNLGSPACTCRRVMLPLMLPAIATGALLVLLCSLLGFSVPSLLQVPVFTVEIYTSFNSQLDQRRAVLMALPLVATGTLVLWAAACLFRRARREAPRSVPGNPPGHCDTDAVNVYCAVVAILAIGLPLLALLLRSLPLTSLAGAIRNAAEEIGTSVLLAALGASLMLTIALAITGCTSRPARWPLGVAALAWLVSGPVLGVGLIQLWNHPGVPGFLYDRFPILVLAVSGRYLVFALLGVRLARQWVPRDTVESARNLGASPWQTLIRVVVPPLRRPLAAVWTCLVLLLLGEVECIVLVAPPGWVPVSLRIFTLMHYGPAAMVSALALVQAAAALGLLGTVGILTRLTGVYTPAKSRYHSGGKRLP